MPHEERSKGSSARAQRERNRRARFFIPSGGRTRIAAKSMPLEIAEILLVVPGEEDFA